VVLRAGSGLDQVAISLNEDDLATGLLECIDDGPAVAATPVRSIEHAVGEETPEAVSDP
jgi:hypothetical protein